MEVVARTDEYTIYKKRNQRYAIRTKARQWVRGDDKVAILLSHKLIEAPAPKAPEPEPAEETAAAADAVEAQAGEEVSEEPPADASGDGEEGKS